MTGSKKKTTAKLGPREPSATHLIVTVKFGIRLKEKVAGVSEDFQNIGWAQTIWKGLTEEERAKLGIEALISGTRSIEIVED